MPARHFLFFVCGHAHYGEFHFYHQVGLLDPSACFVELGAGRGMLGLAVIAALNKNKPTSAASNQVLIL